MSNIYPIKVQQKLSHCQCTLTILASQTDLGRQEQEAFLQAAVLHLAIAMRLYLRELAVYTDHKRPESIYSLADIEAETSEGVTSPFNTIKSQRWIAELMNAERQLLSPQPESASSQLIAINAGTGIGTSVPAKVDYNFAIINMWLTKFKALIEEQRPSFVEY